ncbi:G-protein coupled receptor 183-like isoform 1-T4 [Molossus nigricans]|uniref:G-protein coupled receptor 183-like n=1 Tax=Molossus molossus TaxID=27622 RepID=UPI001747A0B0|nr:G-protein coupled receptor 183-like [Molossus molossus]XP_036106298.1 G-protein coupled receptor 183-like [Molossus molossus]
MAPSTADPSSISHNASVCLPQQPPRAASVTLCLFYTVLLVFSALGNILALYLACLKGKKINSTGVYLVHLAVSDLLFTMALPGKITYYALDFSWPFGEGLCRLTAFVFFMNTYGGVYLMTCVSVDRYLAVVHTHRSLRLRSVRRARLVSVAVWALAVLQTVPLLLIPMTTTVAGKITCMEYNSTEMFRMSLVILVACVISFCGPVGVMLFCYVKIAVKLCRTAQDNPLASGKGHHRRACLLTLVVLVAVVVCFSPYHLNIMQFMARQMLYLPSCSQQRAFKISLQLTVSLMNMNCGFDPVIYFFASTRYRKWLLGILKLRASASSPSSLRRTSSETPSTNKTAGSTPLGENQV